ncbi:hypothetical protein EVG20_g10767, partial [Dentipellis fragilis]
VKHMRGAVSSGLKWVFFVWRESEDGTDTQIRYSLPFDVDSGKHGMELVVGLLKLWESYCRATASPSKYSSQRYLSTPNGYATSTEAAPSSSEWFFSRSSHPALTDIGDVGNAGGDYVSARFSLSNMGHDHVANEIAASSDNEPFMRSTPSSARHFMPASLAAMPSASYDHLPAGASASSHVGNTASGSHSSLTGSVRPGDDHVDNHDDGVEDEPVVAIQNSHDSGQNKRHAFGVQHRLTEHINPDDYEQKYPADELFRCLEPNARVWKVYLDEAKMVDDDMVEAWRDTIDILLVFAGLFSAVVTTFVVQSSQSLQPDYSQVSAMLLTELVGLQRAAANGISAGTVPVSAQNATSGFEAAKSDQWVNRLWFISLAFSLATALMAVLVKQWLQYYVSPISGTGKEKAHIRHFRFTGLEIWHVSGIRDGLLEEYLWIELVDEISQMMIEDMQYDTGAAIIHYNNMFIKELLKALTSNISLASYDQLAQKVRNINIAETLRNEPPNVQKLCSEYDKLLELTRMSSELLKTSRPWEEVLAEDTKKSPQTDMRKHGCQWQLCGRSEDASDAV